MSARQERVEERLRFVTDSPRRRQVIHVLLEATEPLTVLAIHARTLRIKPITVGTCLYRLSDAGFVVIHHGLRQKTFEVPVELRSKLATRINEGML